MNNYWIVICRIINVEVRVISRAEAITNMLIIELSVGQ